LADVFTWLIPVEHKVQLGGVRFWTLNYS